MAEVRIKIRVFPRKFGNLTLIIVIVLVTSGQLTITLSIQNSDFQNSGNTLIKSNFCISFFRLLSFQINSELQLADL